MKNFLSLVIVCMISLRAFAQVRSKVCIVRPNYSDKVVQMINDFIPRIKKLGVENPQQYIDDFLANGTSGSGFVYVAPDGKNYIITNRHVISDAATSTVVFEDEKNKNKKSVSGMKILASDAALDLAILEFPSDQQIFTSGLEFYNGELSDGETVYTAGYPGLMGKPVWQFGNGIITNPSVEVEEMIKPELSSLIQHSAQIDGGNSGGPLLIKTDDGQYKVAGINTWKLTNRQDTNFAIPSDTIQKFIDSALSGKSTGTQDPQTVIIEKASKLHKSLNKYNVTFEELTEYISIEYIEAEGKRIFDRVINQCSIENKKTMNTILEEYSPIESVRYAIGWYIFHEFHKNEYVTDPSKKSSVKESRLPQLNPPQQVEGTDYWNTRLLNGETKKVLIITWTYVNGGWEILTVSDKAGTKEDYDAERRANPNKKSKSKEYLKNIPEGKDTKLGKVIFYMPYTVQIAYGKNQASSQYQNELWSNIFDVNIKIMNLFSAIAGTELQEESVYIYRYGDSFPTPQIKFISPYAGVQLQFPFPGEYIYKMPYLSVSGGAKISDFNNLKVQAECVAKLGGKFYLGLGQNKFGLFIDTNIHYKIYFSDSTKNDYCLNLSFGAAF